MCIRDRSKPDFKRVVMVPATGKFEYGIDEQGLNDAVGFELVVLKEQPEDGKQIYAVYPFKMVCLVYTSCHTYACT